MRIKRWILRIAGAIFLISVIAALKTVEGSKINNIFIGLMGSSLVSFLIELPDYFIEYRRAQNSFLNTSFYIWFYLNQYLVFINKQLNCKDMNISENSFSINIDEINRLFTNFSFIDEYLYSKNPKYKSFLDNTRMIPDALNNNKMAYSYFVGSKKIEKLKSVGSDVVIISDMEDVILDLAAKTREKLELYENEYKKIMDDKKLKNFENAKKSIDEANRNYKDGEVKFK